MTTQQVPATPRECTNELRDSAHANTLGFRFALLIPLVMLFLTSGCATPAGQWTPGPSGERSDIGPFGTAGPAEVGTPERDNAESERPLRTDQTDARYTERQERIVRAAHEILRTQDFVVDGYRYSYDCTGTILAIYAMAGIRLVDLFPNYAGNGVRRLYGIADDYELLYHTELPQPGDLIFWDNTYDKNGDTQWNDWLTHVGLVLSVDSDGTIEYLHHHYTEGVVTARMNLTNPQTYMTSDGVIVNSPMRMRSHRYLNPDEWLSSQLYRELGAMHKIQL
ncbi:MAG: CHAP domain-containing protein [Spirochaetota bacterium]